jgi:hypothetical protein
MQPPSWEFPSHTNAQLSAGYLDAEGYANRVDGDTVELKEHPGYSDVHRANYLAQQYGGRLVDEEEDDDDDGVGSNEQF